jgi:hypothetical protein
MIQAMIVLANLLEGGLEGFLAGVPGPNPNAVTRDTTPRDYLDEKKIPRWYERLLVLYERITVSLKSPNGEVGEPELVWDMHMHVPAGSLINIDHARSYDQTGSDDHTPSDEEFNRLFDEACDSPRDYVFDTQRPDPADPDDRDNFLELVRDFQGYLGSYVFGGREDPMLLQEFIRQVSKDDILETPPRHLIIASHAHWSGQLGIQPSNLPEDKGQSFTYEDVGRFAPELRLDDKYLQPRSNRNQRSLLILTGCAFGQAEPFLRKLRDTINPRLTAVAPLYLYGIGGKNRIFLEYMSKPYTIYSRTSLTRDKLISRLMQGQFLDFHGDDVNHEWEDWVPKEPWEGHWIERAIKPGDPPTVLWYSWIERAAMQSVHVSVDREKFFEDPDRHFKTGIATIGADPTHPLSTAYPFPWWQRFGLADANVMVDQLSWQYEFNESRTGGNTVDAIASGHRYSILVPIVDRSPERFGHRNYVEYRKREPIWNIYNLRSDGPGRRPVISKMGVPDGRNNLFWKVIEPSA